MSIDEEQNVGRFMWIIRRPTIRKKKKKEKRETRTYVRYLSGQIRRRYHPESSVFHDKREVGCGGKSEVGGISAATTPKKRKKKRGSIKLLPQKRVAYRVSPAPDSKLRGFTFIDEAIWDGLRFTSLKLLADWIEIEMYQQRVPTSDSFFTVEFPASSGLSWEFWWSFTFKLFTRFFSSLLHIPFRLKSVIFRSWFQETDIVVDLL